MEIAKQIIGNFKTLEYLKAQAEALTNICRELRTVNQGWHLTSFQRAVLDGTREVLREMANAHTSAIKEVIAHDDEALLAPERAKKIMDSKASTLSVAGRVAFVAFEFRDFQRRGHLSKIDAKEILGDYFERSIERMVGDAVTHSKYDRLAIDVSVEKQWGHFEAHREIIEKKLAGRIHVYEKQLALAAKLSQAAI